MNLKDIAKKTLELIDLTSLNDTDTPQTIVNLCKKAKNDYGQVAAVCIYPKFVSTARKFFNDENLVIKIATVTNFPHGDDNLELALNQTRMAIENGADEVDIVFPYRALIAGNVEVGAKMIAEAKKICGKKTLKVIIESGVLKQPNLIKLASQTSISSGADFIKTSTGKVEVNATLEAAEIMLTTIKESKRSCGFKAAGGIRLVSEAKEYLDLAARIMGETWINHNNFRFGASTLLSDVLNVLDDKASVISSSAY